MACLLALAAPTHAQDPAVSGINGKISAFGGGSGSVIDKDGVGGLAGSLTLPVGRAFGLQIDGAYARVGDANFGSTGAHLFWRDPKQGLLGLYAGAARLDSFGGQNLKRIGAEAQHFTDKITFDAALGYRFGSTFVKDTTYGRGRVQFYPIDNLMLSTGLIYEGRSFGAIGLEYQMSSGKGYGTALFLDGQISNSDNYNVLAGFRVFLGDDMSLKDRHRRQDPDGYTGLDLTATQSGASRARNQPAPAAACPFTPLPLDAAFNWLPGKQYASLPGRLSQCIGQGYTAQSPGPASCGCAAAFAGAPT